MARGRELYALRTIESKREAQRIRWEREPHKMRARILYHGMWTRSRQWGLPFDKEAYGVDVLTDWLMRDPVCPCCKASFRIVAEGGVKSDLSPSVDRRVPSLGYVLGNVALLCWRCNNLKRDATSAELRTVADWMDAQP